MTATACRILNCPALRAPGSRYCVVHRLMTPRERSAAQQAAKDTHTLRRVKPVTIRIEYEK